MLQPALSRKGIALTTIFPFNFNMLRTNTDEISNKNCYFSQPLSTLLACAILTPGEMSRLDEILSHTGEINEQCKNILDQLLRHEH